MWNNKDDKVYRIYQVVDESTGMILPKELRQNYITIKTERNEYTNEHGQRVEVTTRIVKHTGQQRLDI